MTGQNRIEKIAQHHLGAPSPARLVRAGDFVSLRPRHLMTHDNTSAVIEKFCAIGGTRIVDPSQPVVVLDHDVQNRSAGNLSKYERIERFCRDHGIAFHPAKRGIGHQVMVEEGFVLPGSLVVASDSHANLYGALGALGTPVARTDSAGIWATGAFWWRIPEVVRVRLDGRLPSGATGKDLVMALIGAYSNGEVLNRAIEFEGNGIASLSLDQRCTIANMTTEWGALAGLFPCDAVCLSFLQSCAEQMRERGDAAPRLTPESVGRIDPEGYAADPDAAYALEIRVDLGKVGPVVAGPDDVAAIVPVADLPREGIPIQKAYLLSCVNGRVEDLAEAADALRGRKVAPGVRMYVAAASSWVEEEARRLGHWQVLLDAGAIPLPPGCGPCIGLGEGILQPGETAISATNRNFKGRMGSRDATAYLASPAVVAASAAAGKIVSAKPWPAQGPIGEIRLLAPPAAAVERVEILDGFPVAIEGSILFIRKNDLNTDGIFPSDLTYKDGLAPEEIAAAAMRNYDPSFPSLVQGGEILAAGRNFGCGSSREQAATCLKLLGIAIVIAESAAQTYQRNSFNNGFIVIESPALIEELRGRFAGSPTSTIPTGWVARIDFASGRIETGDGIYSFAPLGAAAQELIVAGGLEPLLRRRIQASIDPGR